MAWLGSDPWPSMAHSRFFEVWFGSTSEWSSWSTIISHHKPSLGPQCTTHQIALALGPVLGATHRCGGHNWAQDVCFELGQVADVDGGLAVYTLPAKVTSNFMLITPRRPCSDNGLA